MNELLSPPLGTQWTRTTLGEGALAWEDDALRMSLASAERGRYSDAQIDDYSHLKRARYPWRPPLRMQVEARASLPARGPIHTVLQGTAGFGFWNYPFSVRGDVLMLPEAVWFFYSSPQSNMALVPGIPGWGWKAQVVHSMRPGAFLSIPPLALSTSLALLTGETRPAARWLQHLTGTHEAPLDTDLTTRHMYALEWRAHEARFLVDEQEVLRAPNPPTRPLGFVTWLDNQFAIATPRGVLRFGTVSSGPQWFEIANLAISPLAEV